MHCVQSRCCCWEEKDFWFRRGPCAYISQPCVNEKGKHGNTTTRTTTDPSENKRPKDRLFFSERHSASWLATIQTTTDSFLPTRDRCCSSMAAKVRRRFLWLISSFFFLPTTSWMLAGLYMHESIHDIRASAQIDSFGNPARGGEGPETALSFL